MTQEAARRDAEAALVRAALDAGLLARDALDAAVAEVARRRGAGEQVTLPQALAPRLAPAARAQLAAVYRAALERPAASDATWLPDGGAPAGRGAPAPVAAPGARPSGRAPAATAALPEPGERVDGHEVLRELGRGAMGAVYVARDPAGREVALKVVLPRSGADDGVRRERFAREARAVARLDHPGIVRVHAFGRDAVGRDYLVMERIVATPLDARLEAEERLAPAEAARVALGLARAVQHAHAHGVLHRDIKPGNVLLRPDGAPVLVDFGLARTADDEALTKTGQLLGTPAYMAPEQLKGGAAVGPATDIYGVGATLWAMLTGGPRFGDRPLPAMIAALLHEDAPTPSSACEGLPPAIDAICARCLARAPEGRYPDAGALARDLDAFLRGAPVAALAEHRRRRGRGRSARAAALAVAAALALGARWRAAPASPGPDPAPAGDDSPGAPPEARPTRLTREVAPGGADAWLVARLVSATGPWTLTARRADAPDDEPPAWAVSGEDARALVLSRRGAPPLEAAALRVAAVGPPGQAGAALVVTTGPEDAAPPVPPLAREVEPVDAAAAFPEPRLRALALQTRGSLRGSAKRARERRAGRATGLDDLTLVEEIASLEAQAEQGGPLARLFALEALLGAAEVGDQGGVGRLLRRAAAESPDEPRLWWCRAQAALAAGEADALGPAREDLRRVVAAWPEVAAPRLALARALAQLDDAAGGLAAARVVLARDPEHPEANALVGALTWRVEPARSTALAWVERAWLAFCGRPEPDQRLLALEPCVEALAAWRAEDPTGASTAAAALLARIEQTPSSLNPRRQGLSMRSPGAAARFERVRLRALALAGRPAEARDALARLRSELGPNMAEARATLDALAAELGP